MENKTLQTSTGQEHLDELLVNYANANFDCGAWDEDDEDFAGTKYEEWSFKAAEARQELVTEIRFQLRIANTSGAVES